MKKTLILLMFAGACSLAGKAQTKVAGRAPATAAPQVNTGMATDPEAEIYNRALKYGDYEAAKNAIYMLMLKHPGNRSYLDSLTQIYFSMGAYPQCILAGTDFLQGPDSTNTGIMELVAVANSNLNRHKEALEMWEKLWLKAGNPQYAYQVAVNQYMIKRYGECAQTIDIILKDPAADKEKVTVSSDDKNSQKVPMKAAANNLMGVIYKELNKPDQAKGSFEAALKVSPDFEIAKNNIDQMNRKEAPKTEAQPKATAPKKK